MLYGKEAQAVILDSLQVLALGEVKTMLGFLKSRPLRNVTAAGVDSTNDPLPASRPLSETPSAQPSREARTHEVSAHAEAVVAPIISATELPASPAVPGRYEVRENIHGCWIHDLATGDVAETYGYRLSNMSLTRARSLVDVLNRGAGRRPNRPASVGS